MVIQTNILAANAQLQYNIVENKKAKSTEKLSSGYRVNRAADDAAGLAISEKMRRQIRGIDRGAANIMDGIGYVQVADGALNEVTDMLQRMNELAVQSANGTNSDKDREFLDSEFQKLKNETERIFKTSSFNDRKIWVPEDQEMIQVGTKTEPTLKFSSSAVSVDTQDANADVLPLGGIEVIADDNAVTLMWKGYNGVTYKTSEISWDTLEQNNYSINAGDYFPDSAKDSGGRPLFNFNLSFTPNQYATKEDIKEALNNTRMSTGRSSSYSAGFENSDGTGKSYPGISVGTGSAHYDASYVSFAKGNHTFDASDDPFISPKGTGNCIPPSAATVDQARNSSEKWTFKFNMDGIGEVTAVSNSSSLYWAPSDVADDDENVWWRWNYTTDSHGNKNYYKATVNYALDGTLGGVMDALTGKKGLDSKPGLLNSSNGGDADNGGTIRLWFDAYADTPYSAGAVSGSRVFSFCVDIGVSSADTEESVFNKINNALNSNTILDVNTPSSASERVSIGNPYCYKTIETPVYGYPDGTFQDLIIQSGFNLEDQIHINYECLSNSAIGTAASDILTTQNSLNSINDIAGALEKVSSQRADFGAYQNRLEHAYMSNKNTVENTQAAESQIRDTDMATEMVEFSKQNILAQVGTSMMSQANHSADGVMSLLQ